MIDVQKNQCLLISNLKKTNAFIFSDDYGKKLPFLGDDCVKKLVFNVLLRFLVTSVQNIPCPLPHSLTCGGFGEQELVIP